MPENIPDPRYFIYRAALLLTVGQVDEARTEIEGALSLDSKNGQAVALQSIIALVHNEKEKALNFARQAVAADPNSASARIALSYVQQAEFDLKGALTSVQEAVKLAPENALAWSRLAELRSSFGRLDESLKAARKAVALNPDLARTQMVLGFAYLTQVKTAESKQAFEKAIVLDQAAPLPRLGLGLAKIRDGDLDGGGREIEIAASLDPNNSLIRSYLGKLYYEEKRTKLDQREYAIAKELDPKDPTPWFYDAIAKQTSNRPVEALRDYQKSIELNDNRAVYRSKLLLDSDEAARQSALARIYSDLGFQQLALVEGWKSVNIDPTNFSAHRFLADSYSVLPRREIARVSELLQSQLLQPINITPIQPRLGESNLFLISAQGPAGLSSNEFNPIFNRNRVAAQGSGLAGGNDTYGGEGVLSGIYKKFSFSGGYNHFETDGWRKNADQNDDIANAFAQIELSYKTSIQAEYRYRDTHNGDLELRFFKDDFRPEFKEKEDTKTYRMGLRHGFSPSSIILASGIYQNRDTKLHDEPTVAFINSIDQEFKDQEAFSGELQHLFRSNYINLTSGLGYFDIDKDQKLTTELNLPPPPFGPGPITTVDKFDQDVNHLNLYLYSQIKPLSNLTFTLGASGDFFNTDSSSTEDKNQFNPKFGVSWNPYSGTTLRGAVFRTLKRTLITDQTLEPTQVAGFNQFFDDADATEAWTYGIGVNQKFTKAIYGGAEFFYRDLTVPFQVGSDVDNANWDEYQGRAYLFWTPHPWVSLSAEYYYERIEKEDFRPDVDQVTTYRVPLGLRLFHPSGLNAFVGPTYVHQDGDFLRRGAAAFESDDDDFWLVDAAINYRLPKRYGFISVGVTNLFDKKFNYQEFDLKNPSIQPDRSFVASITLAFP